MGGKLFLIHWNATEAEEYANALRNDGWEVNFEWEDGARAGKAIKENPPDAIVIYLSRLPSHGRETADGLQSLKATRHLPIIFVDGKEEAVEKTKAKVPNALYTTSAGLREALANLVQPGNGPSN